MGLYNQVDGFMNRLFRTYCLVILAAVTTKAAAQNISDEQRFRERMGQSQSTLSQPKSMSDYDKELNEFRNEQQRKFKEFRNQRNAEFAEFLKKPWEQADGNEPLKEAPKMPDIPIVELPIINVEVPKENRINVNIEKPKIEKVEKPEPIAPVVYTPKPKEKTLLFVFYGTEGTVRFDMNGKATLKGSAEKDVSAFWSELSKDNYDNLLADCLNLKEELDLCDWAYFKMTEKVSETIYGKSNEMVVFHTWLLTQSGFRVRLGRDNGRLHLLLNTNFKLVDTPYWTLDDGNYFLLDGSKIDKMNIVRNSFSGTKALRLAFDSRNMFTPKETTTRDLQSKRYPDLQAQVACNKNLLDFMADYPATLEETYELTDWAKYAYTPLSESARNRLYPALMSQIQGKSEADAANIILNFVQTAFEYKTDPEVWGKERAFFPEETLFYPYCDCEDRAILFCRLVTDLMGLNTALVYYPGHLATAVQFNTDIPGDYFIIDGKRFLICDPTYINAGIGMTMPRHDNSTAKVLLLNY